MTTAQVQVRRGRLSILSSRDGSWLLRLLPVLSVALVVAVWLIGYQRTTFVPSPGEVWQEARVILTEGSTYQQIFVSLRRLVTGLVLGLGIGLLLSLQGARSTLVERMVATYVSITFAMPSLLIALLSLVIFGVSAVAPIFVVTVLVFPFATVPLLQGIKSLDRGQIEMARVYGSSRYQVVREIALPHMAPYVFSAIRNAHALGWKVLIVAEIFTVRTGIGGEFHSAFDRFNLPLVMVWLMIFLAVIAFIEYGVLSVAERRVFQWRARPSTTIDIGRAVSSHGG